MIIYLKRLKSSKFVRVKAFPMYDGIGMSVVSAPDPFLQCACAKGGWGAEKGSGDTARTNAGMQARVLECN